MKTLAALGIAGGFLFVARGWISPALILWVAGRFSNALAVTLFREAQKAGGSMKPGDVVLIGAFDGMPEYWFLV